MIFPPWTLAIPCVKAFPCMKITCYFGNNVYLFRILVITNTKVEKGVLYYQPALTGTLIHFSFYLILVIVGVRIGHISNIFQAMKDEKNVLKTLLMILVTFSVKLAVFEKKWLARKFWKTYQSGWNNVAIRHTGFDNS